MKDLRFKRKYFLPIQSGQKTLECRINYPFLRSVKIGDWMKYFWEHLSVIVEIAAIRHYQTFKEMLSKENVEKLVPGMSKEQALSEYESIYPEWKVRKNSGLVVFEIKVIRK